MDAAPMDAMHLAMNRRSWNERAPLHAASPFYDVEGVIAGRSTLHPFEAEELGDVTGCSLVHLQCHLGTDTVSWARRGATVTGLDFSESSIDVARSIAERSAVAADFVVANVYDAVTTLGRSFDVVYTGLGAICWLKDIRAWAQVVADLLVPGGRFYMLEFHPLLGIMADEAPVLDPKYPYFWRAAGTVIADDHDYAAGPDTLRDDVTIEWSHPIGDVVTALLSVGLELKMLKEHDVIAYAPWEQLVAVEGEINLWRLPPGQPQIPLEYSLLAVKPA